MALANTDFIQLPVDSTGKKSAFKAATIGGATIYIPASVLYSEDGSMAATIHPAGFLRTTDEPRQVFYDPFDGSVVDVTNRWTAGFAGTGAATPAQTGGVLTVASGTVANAYATLGSQSSFTLPIPGWMGFSFAIALPDGAAPAASGTRFWGQGSITTPTAAIPVIDGVGFEMLNGKMYAVVYANGTRTAVADLSAATGTGTQPTDANNHRYIVYVRTDKVYWYIDSLAAPVASSNFQSPQIQTLPERFVSVASTTTQVTFTCAGAAVWDTGKNATQVADGTYPWRKATVDSYGALAAAAPDHRYAAQTLGTVVANTQTWDCNGAVDALITVGTTTTGTVIIEVSNDGTNFLAAEVYDGGLELWVPGAFIPTTNKTYRVITAGYRTLRVRTVTTLAATVSLTATLSSTPALIRAIDTGASPHQYGYTETAITAQYTTAQTSTVLGPTVAATQFIVVTSIQIQAGGTVAGTLQVYLGTSTYARGTNKAIFDGEFAPSATLKPGFAMDKSTGWKGALDEEIRVTGVGAINPLTITTWYYIVG